MKWKHATHNHPGWACSGWRIANNITEILTFSNASANGTTWRKLCGLLGYWLAFLGRSGSKDERLDITETVNLLAISSSAVIVIQLMFVQRHNRHQPGAALGKIPPPDTPAGIFPRPSKKAQLNSKIYTIWCPVKNEKKVYWHGLSWRFLQYIHSLKKYCK